MRRPSLLRSRHFSPGEQLIEVDWFGRGGQSLYFDQLAEGIIDRHREFQKIITRYDDAELTKG